MEKGTLVGEMQRSQPQHVGIWAKAQPAGNERRRGGASPLQHRMAVDGALLLDFQTRDGDVELDLAHRIAGDAGAGPAAALEQAGRRKLAQGAIDGGAGAAEFLRQFHLTRQQIARQPDPLDDAAQDLRLNAAPGMDVHGAYSLCVRHAMVAR
jgi:hypothetical protein